MGVRSAGAAVVFPHGVEDQNLKDQDLMKKMFRLGATVAALSASLGMGTVAHAQDTASADAFAEILTALQLQVATGTSLDFGAMVVSGAGTVTLDASSGLDCTTANIVCSGTTGLVSFDVSGTALKDVTINFGTPTATLLRSGGTSGDAADELKLDNYNSDAAFITGGPTDFYQVTLDGSGDSSFDVGGDLTFDGSEVAGTYEGTFSVSVEYS